MRIQKTTYSILFVVSFLLLGFGLPKKIEKKVVKEVEKTFEVSNFSFQSIVVDSELNVQLPAKVTAQNFNAIYKNDELLGYVFVDQAPSKTAKFDYLVLFNNKLEIVHSKILIYREEYGGEIGSKRWLKQFFGKTGSDRVDYETNIDGISGATISVRSMTIAMDNLLQSIGILQENKIL
ncbi:FMN-binding protein [Aurantibacter sp.]|uniref:FMN-binding protein n=1 Tax=Aurantibacter sp. TaxID=2807103 RepID=UPI00326692C8